MADLKDDPRTALRSLVQRLAQSGRLLAIWLGPARGSPMLATDEVLALAEQGLVGDRASAGRGGGKRPVTLLQAEHLPVIAALCGRRDLVAEMLRRILDGVGFESAGHPGPVCRPVLLAGLPSSNGLDLRQVMIR